MDRQAELYTKYLKFTDLMFEEYPPLEVAAIMSVISLSLYKTLLDDEGFQNMVDKISESRNEVKSLKVPPSLLN